MTPLVCLGLGMAVLAACGPAARRLNPVGAARTPSGGPRPGSAVRARWRPRARRRDVDLTALLAQVAAQVRAGAPPRAAWARALGAPPVGAVPTLTELLGAQTGRVPPGLTGRAAAALAAGRLADDLGAPLADLLDRVGDALATEAELESDRRAALAGPRSTATVLSWLPALGLVLGTGLGADPLGVLLGGGVGTAAGVLGLAALLAGRAWTRALLARAARPPRPTRAGRR